MSIRKKRTSLFLFTMVTSICLMSAVAGCSLSDEQSSLESKSISSVFSSPISAFSIEESNSSAYHIASSTCESTNKDLLIYSQLFDKVTAFAQIKEESEESDSFLFFTDPHNFSPNNSFYIDDDWFLQNFELLKEATIGSGVESIVCGGDILNNNDTKEQAIYKLRYFVEKMKLYFTDYYYVVGNHDTNYQGDSYMLNGDSNSCSLSQEEINSALFYEKKSYYYFDSHSTRHYCFDSGVDWENGRMSDYQKEQLVWFANDLTNDSKPHYTVIIHIALNDYDGHISFFMESIGKIIKSFNDKKRTTFGEFSFDFSKTDGHIDYIQCGHLHKDFSSYRCGDVPIIATRTFSSPEVATQPTFDIVLSNYSDHKIYLFRVGDGDDRVVEI